MTIIVQNLSPETVSISSDVSQNKASPANKSLDINLIEDALLINRIHPQGVW